MKGTFRRKAARPTKEVKASLRNLTLDFAMAGDMITDREYAEACLGNVYVSPKTIMNINADLWKFPTGTTQDLYPGRGTIISNKAFLEFEG